MSEQLHKIGNAKRSLWDWSGFVAFFGAIGTVSMYLVARSYYDGYLYGLGLSSSMFPMPSGDVSVLAAIAIFRSILLVFTELLGAGALGWLKAVAIVVFFIAGWGALNLLESRASKSVQSISWGIKKVLGWLFHPVALHWTKPAVGALAVIYVVICSLAAVMALIFLLLWPYFTVGKDTALEEIRHGFSDSPQVRLKNPDGADEDFRLIQCSAQFCAFFSEGKIVAAPLSEMKWVVSKQQR